MDCVRRNGGEYSSSSCATLDAESSIVRQFLVDGAGEASARATDLRSPVDVAEGAGEGAGEREACILSGRSRGSTGECARRLPPALACSSKDSSARVCTRGAMTATAGAAARARRRSARIMRGTFWICLCTRRSTRFVLSSFTLQIKE